MSASWDWNDEQRLRSVVMVEDFDPQPMPSPFEFDDSDPLGCIKGSVRAFCFMVAACLVIVALYLIFA